MKSVAGPIVYVDSGSTDGSQMAARKAGAKVVELDLQYPFTAARARNAGMGILSMQDPRPALVQFIDGDCELRSGWISVALSFLEDHPHVGAVCGRRRERYPEASIYNWLIDREWDTQVGETRACGGDVLMRIAALTQVGGFNPDLIAGEEPELCIRLRHAGWSVWRLDEEMTLHDVAMTRFSQWWRRCRRAGHAFAEGAALHGHPPERHGIRETRSALIWGLGLPLAAVFGLPISSWALLLLLAWPLQVLRLRIRGEAWTRAFFLTIGKFPESLGAIGYWWGRLRGRSTQLIEYKGL